MIYGFLNIRTGILDYLREGFPWPAQPFKHTESNSFKHTATTFKYTNWYFILPPGSGHSGPPSTYCFMSIPSLYVHVTSIFERISWNSILKVPIVGSDINLLEVFFPVSSCFLISPARTGVPCVPFKCFQTSNESKEFHDFIGNS